MKIILLAGLCVFAGIVYAKTSMDRAEDAREPAQNPKKKKAGEECKSSDECQRHHACNKVGNKSVCVAPVYSEIPET